MEDSYLMREILGNFTIAAINGTDLGYSIDNETENTVQSNSKEVKSWNVNWYIIGFVGTILTIFSILATIRHHQQKITVKRQEDEYLAYFHSILPHSKIYCRSSYSTSQETKVNSPVVERRSSLHHSLEKVSGFFKDFNITEIQSICKRRLSTPSDNDWLGKKLHERRVSLPFQEAQQSASSIEEEYELQPEVKQENKNVFTISKHKKPTTSDRRKTSCARLSTTTPAILCPIEENAQTSDIKSTCVHLEAGKNIKILITDEKSVDRLFTDSTHEDTWL